MGDSPNWGRYVSNTLGNSYVITYGSMFSEWWFVFEGHINHIAHEYGHAVGLHHTYNSEPINISHYDFLDDVFGLCGESSCCIAPSGQVCYLKRVCFWDFQPTPYPLMYGGTENQRYISPKQSGRMHRSLSLYDNIFVVNNKNMHRYVKEITPFETSLKITQNETWDFKIKSYQNIIIKTGNTLTIKCEVMMPNDGKIIVEQGARLIIDGGKVTNYHYLGKNKKSFWQGIQVWGTTDKNQYPTNNPTHQGMLVLKNGGTIENAHLGAINWNPEHWDQIGGVIQSIEGVFKNNRQDIAFMQYQNYKQNYPNILINDISYFKNTDFISDDDFIEKGLTIQPHASLWRVSGVKFTNCHFSNEITIDKDNSSAPIKGIYSINAGFSVDAGCSSTQPIGQPCPPANLLKSSFTGFNTAIEASAASTSEVVKVQQTDFIDNVWGIKIDELDNASINRNDIAMGDAGYPFYPFGAGIFLDNSTGYIVEENKVHTTLTSGLLLGIGANNSTTVDNVIYKNKLDNLVYGTTSYGINHKSFPKTGLQFLCNKYTNNEAAIQIESSPIDGIRLYQGNFSPNISAGNTFVNNTMDIVNNTNSIIYYYNGVNTEPINISGMVSSIPATSANTCPTSYGGGIILGMREAAIDSLSGVLATLMDDYMDLKYLYLSLIDGGSTEELENQIETNWSDNTWLLRGKLIEKSPYLSTEILLITAEQNILPNAMLLEILLANPDATRGEVFITKLKKITGHSFPEYMIDFVRNNWDSNTLRTNLEGQISAVHSELSVTENYLKHLEKSGDEYTYSTRLNTVNRGGGIANKIGMMDFYIENSQFEKADSVLQAIQNDKSMKDELDLVADFDDYVAFRSSLGPRNLAQLDSTEISYLQTLAENKNRVAGYAQNILCFFYNICYEKELPFGAPQPKSMMGAGNTPELEDVLYNITVYPNPATAFSSIKWEIYDELKNARYSVVDLNGREFLNGVLSDNKGEQAIDTRKLSQGVYIIGIYNNNQLKVTKKLVIESRR